MLPLPDIESSRIKIIEDLSRSRVPEEISFLLPSDFIAECNADIFETYRISHRFFKRNTGTDKGPDKHFYRSKQISGKDYQKGRLVSAILPLEKTEFEYYLFVDSITDNHGDQLREISSTQDEGRAGCYSVRRGGCEPSMRWMPKIF